jgi:hypothetical protein
MHGEREMGYRCCPRLLPTLTQQLMLTTQQYQVLSSDNLHGSTSPTPPTHPTNHTHLPSCQVFATTVADYLAERMAPEEAARSRTWATQDRTDHMLTAAQWGDCEAITTLLRRGISPDCADYDNSTALFVATVNNQEVGAASHSSMCWQRQQQWLPAHGLLPLSRHLVHAGMGGLPHTHAQHPSSGLLHTAGLGCRVPAPWLPHTASCAATGPPPPATYVVARRWCRCCWVRARTPTA